jgi:NTP pyrophosphatase (non-canonical NTP hydrolase)
MDISELSDRMDAFVQTKGWYAPDSPKPQTPPNLAVSLALEAAEVLEHFQWQAEVQDRQALGAELADVALYLLQLSRVCEIDLEQAILDKLRINTQRTWGTPPESSDER